MEVTYSQDLIIRDPALLATLGVFCKRTYLPYHGVAEDVRLAASEADYTAMVENIDRELANDPEVEELERWKDQHALLLNEKILEFLPRQSSHQPSDHPADRNPGDIYPDFDQRGAFAKSALGLHAIRADLPGTALFECDRSSGDVELAKEVMFIEAPKIQANDEEICQLRETAQRRGIEEFWQFIEQQATYANGVDESYIARAEKIRNDYSAWWNDNWLFRGKALGVLGLVTLCFASSAFAPFATFAGASWIGEVNHKWAQRKMLKNQAFKFISKVDGMISKFAT